MKLRGIAAALSLVAGVIATGTTAQAAVHVTPHGDEDTLIPPRPSMVDQLFRSIGEPPIASNQISSEHSEITLLVLYEPTLPNAAARIDELVALTNSVYAQSGVAVSFTLAAISPYTPTSALNRDVLREITDDSTAQNLRTTFRADMVTIIRPFDSSAHGGCGTAWVIGDDEFDPFSSPGFVYQYTYSVVSTGSDGSFFCSDLSLAHELGHNFGAVHDPDNTSITPRLPYAYGFGSEGSFGTVMSYIDPEVEVFSNPDLTCNGFVCGNAASADVARAINEVRDFFSQLSPDFMVPDAPSITDTTPLVDAVSLEFQAGNDGGQPIESFTASCGAASVQGSASPLTISGLAPATTYGCSVSARNSVGDSDESSIVEVTTLPIPSPEIESIDSYDEELTVNLAPAEVLGSYQFLGFDVTCGTESVFTSTNRAVFSGLTNEQSYDCSASASTSLGTSAVSGTVAGVPEAVATGLNLILIQAALESQ